MTSPLEPKLLIRPAYPRDLTALLELRREASTWLRQRGINQWTADKTDEIRANLEGSWTWVVEDAARVIASITLRGADLDFWRPEDDLESALYVYKAMTARSHAGKDIGGAMLDWASDRAARLGYQWIRLDCWRDNTALHNYYLRHGFTHLRTVVVPGRQSGALFQRPAARRDHPFREVIPA